MKKGSIPLDLSDYRLNAGVDYITLSTPGKVELPRLFGKPCWAASHHYHRLTIHDLPPRDVIPLSGVLPNAPVAEFEVFVDFWPVAADADKREFRNRRMLTHLAHNLWPHDVPSLKHARARIWNPTTGRFVDKGMECARVPSDGQLLYNSKHDEVQVKAYIKRVDYDGSRRQLLPPEQHRMRLEVAFRGEYCADQLPRLEHLGLFDFRRRLAPYLRTMSGPRVDLSRLSRRIPVRLRDPWSRTIELHAQDVWSQRGVQALRDHDQVRLRRDPELNRRIGLALDGLNGRFGTRKKVARILNDERRKLLKLKALSFSAR